MLIFNRFNTVFFFLLGLLFATIPGNSATFSTISDEKAILQELQVSIGGFPVSSGSTQNLGSINLLSSSTPLTITLENIGAPETLNISSVSLTGSNTGDFVLNTTGFNNALGSAATTNFTITFTPTASGARNAAIEIVSDDLNSPFIINLEGTGVKLNQTITFDALAAKTYGDASFTLGASATSSLAVSYASDNLSVATISGNTVTIVGAGSATITASQVGNVTYNAATSVPQTLTVNKVNLTVTADNQTKVYSAVNPALTITYAGFITGDNSSVLDVPPAISTTATTGSTVGTYPITASGASDNNYSFTYVAGTLSISKATPSITWAAPSPITYGAALTSTQLNAGTPVAGAFTYTPTLGTILNAGVNQTLSVDFIPTDAINYNSVIGSTTQLTVNKATVTVTADNKARVYNVAEPPFTLTYLGFVNGETAAVLDVPPTASTTATQSSPVGSYPITVSGASDNNYSFNYVGGTLTITKATPVVSWSNPASITYGTALSSTQLNATATVAGSFVYAPAAGAILNVGASQVLSVNFTPSDATNYNVVNGTTVLISVTKAMLTVTANNQSRTYGAPNPALSEFKGLKK